MGRRLSFRKNEGKSCVEKRLEATERILAGLLMHVFHEGKGMYKEIINLSLYTNVR
jgi:hypothetical protein